MTSLTSDNSGEMKLLRHELFTRFPVLAIFVMGVILLPVALPFAALLWEVSGEEEALETVTEFGDVVLAGVPPAALVLCPPTGDRASLLSR